MMVRRLRFLCAVLFTLAFILVAGSKVPAPVAPEVTSPSINGEYFAGDLPESGLLVLTAGAGVPTPPQDILILMEAPARMDTSIVAGVVRVLRALPASVRIGFQSGPGVGGDPFRTMSAWTDSELIGQLSKHSYYERTDPATLPSSWPSPDTDRLRLVIYWGSDRYASFNQSSSPCDPALIDSYLARRIVVSCLVDGWNTLDGNRALLSRLSGGTVLSLKGLSESGPILPIPELTMTSPEIIPPLGNGVVQGETMADLYARAFALLLPIHAYHPVASWKDGRALQRADGSGPWIGRWPLAFRTALPTASELSIQLEDQSVAWPAGAASSGGRTRGDRYLDAFEIPQLSARRDVMGLSPEETAWLGILQGRGAPPNPVAARMRGRVGSTAEFLELFTGRVAIEESLQLDQAAAASTDAAATVPLASLTPPPLKHLDYTAMLGDSPVVDFPLTEACPADMAALTFASIDDAFPLGDFVEHWSDEFGRIYLDEVDGALFARKFLDRLAIRIDRDLRPFYSLAVGSFGFFINEPTFGMTQDVALVMKPRSAATIRDRFAGYREEFKQAHPDAHERQETIEGEAVTILQTPDRAISSYAYIGSDLVVVATSGRTLARILATARGRAPSLAAQPDVRFLASRLHDAQGALILGDAFINRLMLPDWRIKFDRRSRCMAALARLRAAQLFASGRWGVSDSGIPMPSRCPDHGEYREDHGRIFCTVHGYEAFATPLEELSVTAATSEEAEAYRQFAARYQEFWRRAIDPVGIGVRHEEGGLISFHTLILPLIEQSQYKEMQRWLGADRRTPLDAWSGFPASTVLVGVFHNPFAAWLRGDDADFGRTMNLEEHWKKAEGHWRETLGWPADQPIFDWLDDQWGFASLDFAPEDLGALSQQRHGGFGAGAIGTLPVGVFVSVKDEARAWKFLDTIRACGDKTGRAGFRLREVRQGESRLYQVDLMGFPIQVGIKDHRLIAALTRGFLEPDTSATLASDGNLSGRAGRLIQEKVQGLVLFQGSIATGMKRILETAFLPLEADACRGARRRSAGGTIRDTDCPYGGAWQRTGGVTFCSKHDRATRGRMPAFLAATENSVRVSPDFPLLRKFAEISVVGMSLHLTSDGLEAHLVVNNPFAAPPSVAQRISRSMLWVGIGLALVIFLVLAWTVRRWRRRRTPSTAPAPPTSSAS